MQRDTSPWLGMLWSSPAWLMVPSPSPLALGTRCRAVPVMKPGRKTLGLCLEAEMGEFSPPLLPSLSITFPWEKAALNFFPGSSCRGRAQRVASTCHVTLVFAVSHAMTSQADWRTMEIKFLYVKMEKLLLSRKQAGGHQLQMGRKKKKACLSG